MPPASSAESILAFVEAELGFSLLPWLDELKRRCSTQRASRPAEPTPSGLGTLGALLEQAKRKG
jgi:hypothetical protein